MEKWDRAAGRRVWLTKKNRGNQDCLAPSVPIPAGYGWDSTGTNGMIGQMKRVSFVATAFLLHLLLGNFCLINVASAMEEALQPEVLSHASEDDLTPMSRREPAKCPWAVQDVSNDAPAQTPCDSGRCFAPPAPVASSPDIAPGETVGSAIALPECDSDPVLPSTEISLPDLSERPPPLIAVETVVLRR